MFKKPQNPKEVQRLAEEIEEITRLGKAKKIDKYEFYTRQQKLFREINKYQLESDVQREVKKGLRIAKYSLRVLEQLGKATMKIAETREKLKKKTDKLLRGKK